MTFSMQKAKKTYLIKLYRFFCKEKKKKSSFKLKHKHFEFISSCPFIVIHMEVFFYIPMQQQHKQNDLHL